MNKFAKFIKRNAFGLSAATFAPVLVAPTALAGVAAKEGDEATDLIINAVVGIVLKIFFYIGIVLLCWSVGMLVMAFRNEEPDSKSRAIMLLIVSICLIGLRPFLTAVLGAANFTLT